MKRRDFAQKIALATMLPGITAASRPKSRPSLIKPRRLKQGDLVALITPGSYAPDAQIEKAVKNLEEMGFRVALGQNIRAKYGYVAGQDEQRLKDLHWAFSNPEVNAIWCARGGYGCTRLLPAINYDLIRQNPKVFIGYSDITALHLAFLQRSGLITFHGQVAQSKLTPYTLEHFLPVLMEGKARHVIALHTEYQEHEDQLYRFAPMRNGVVRGELAGGNLTLLAAMAGTEFGLNAKGKLVFMEDIEEKPYRVDRMLTQLRQASQLDQAAGFALGIFAGCGPEADEDSLSLYDAVNDRLGSLNLPSAYGFSFGHVSHQCTLPQGIRAELDTVAKTITLLEAAVM